MSSSQLPFGLKRLAKAPEKPNFAHTCNLLSQYVKEKGSLKDLNLVVVGIGGKMEATGKSNVTTPTMNLLSNIENIGQSSMQQAKPLDSLPGFATVLPEEEAMETKSSQMTIFYGGKVLVFDDIPADKAIEIMQLANNGSSSGDFAAEKTDKHSSADTGAPSSKAPSPVSAQEWPRPQSRPSSSKAPPPVSAPKMPQPQTEANASDLPIARRSSLHRFLEKRKDRALARGPYNQVQNAAAASSSSKNEEQLELKL